MSSERLDALRSQPIAATEKGFAGITSGRAVSAASFKRSPVPALDDEFTMPLLVLRDSALAHNAAAMAGWCAEAGVLLAPPGKTTMAPQLFARPTIAGSQLSPRSRDTALPASRGRMRAATALGWPKRTRCVP